MKTLTLSTTALIPPLTGSSPSLINSGLNFLKAVSFTYIYRVFTLILLYYAEYIVTHAPIAPWLTDDTTVYPSGAYHAVAESVGGVVDWWNIQFYNQGSDYTTCDEILTQSNSDYPHTSIFEINQYSNVPLSNLLIGKPAAAADASTGYLDPNTLAGCLQQGQSAGWNGGAMFWEYPDATSDLITTVRSQSFPV
jgi:chitinase